ncbi:MAG: hypothetical protein M3Z04_03910 [Chloroflexota bacterium]|nr:hypothetical protein [Chloroflexota bacterium]
MTALADNDLSVRYRAAAVLGQSRADRAVAALIKALADDLLPRV